MSDMDKKVAEMNDRAKQAFAGAVDVRWTCPSCRVIHVGGERDYLNGCPCGWKYETSA